MCILDGKEYAALQDGRNQMEAEVTRCNLLVNNQVPSSAGSSGWRRLSLCFACVQSPASRVCICTLAQHHCSR